MRVVTAMMIMMTMAWANTARADDVVKYKAKTVIDLRGATIEGELIKPEGSYIVNRKLSKFAQLIQTRQHYLDELRLSDDDL